MVADNDVLKEFRNMVNGLIRRSHPTDMIKLTHESNMEVMKIWDRNVITEEAMKANDVKRNDSMISDIPADLLIMDTVPVMDCRFEVDGWDFDFMKGAPLDFRVCIFNESDRIPVGGSDDPFCESPDSAEIAIVGSLEIEGSPTVSINRFSVPLVFGAGENTVGYAGALCTIRNQSSDRSCMISELREPVREGLINDIGYIVHECLSTWYGSQLCMLYPAIKEVLGTPGIMAEQNIHKKFGKARKRPIRHIKVHTINADDIRRLKYGDDKDRSFQRKTMVWHVCGHYRTLKDGRKTWVRPYYKGPGLDLLTPELRDRIITSDGVEEGRKSLVYGSFPDAEKKSKDNAKKRPNQSKSKQADRPKKSHTSL